MNKFKLIFIVLLFSWLSAFSQPVYFNKTVDIGNITGSGISILEKDSGYIIGTGIVEGQIEIGILMLDTIGNLSNLITYGKIDANCYPGRPGSLKFINGDYILGGSIDYNVLNVGFILKINDQGDSLFSKEYANQISDDMFFNNSCPTFDKGYIFTGQYHINGFNSDVIILKTDSSGNESWRKIFGWNTVESGFSIIQTPDSGYVVGGYTYTPGLNDSGDPLLLKFDKNGNYLWNRKPGGPLDDKQVMVCMDDDSSFFALTMYSDSALTYEAEYGTIRVLKYSNSGNIIWDKRYGSSKLDNFVGNIKALTDGGAVCCGSGIDSSGYYRFGWILRLNGYGDSIWLRDYAYYDYSYGRNYLRDISQTTDNGYIACGETYADSPYNLQKIWVLKVDSIGCDTAGCDPTVWIVEEDENTRIREGERMVIWPNPARDLIHIRTMMDDGRYNMGNTLTIYDIYGRTITAQTQTILPSYSPTVLQSSKEITLDVSSYPQGLYIITITGDHQETLSGKFVIHR